MKRFFWIAVLAIGFVMPVSVNATLSATHSQVVLEDGPGNCIHPPLARRIIRKAAEQAEMEFQPCWVMYVQGINDIQTIPGGYRVSLQTASGGFVIVDVLGDL